MIEGEYKHKFNKFWDYFIKTWTQTYDPKCWNIRDIIESEKESAEDILINRTNNPLERFNRVLNGIGIHPPMHKFIESVKEISQTYVDNFRTMDRLPQKRRYHAKPKVPDIPDDYLKFLSK